MDIHSWIGPVTIVAPLVVMGAFGLAVLHSRTPRE